MQSRRRFLNSTSAVASQSVLGANDRVQMAIIGTGNRGTQVHRAFQCQNDVVFTAACDVARSRMDAFVGSATVHHTRNFLDCVKSRQKPACHIEVGFHSTLPCLLALEAIRKGRSVGWDGKLMKAV